MGSRMIRVKTLFLAHNEKWAFFIVVISCLQQKNRLL